MFVTARQVEDLHRQNGSNGQVTLPYRARLTPMAADWVKARKIAVGYGDRESESAEPRLALPKQDGGAFLWWCDGPCGPAKAAIVAQEKESKLAAIDLPSDGKQLVAVLKVVASQVQAGKALGAILLVQHGASATVFANRCPSLRAILGTCMEAVEQGVQQVAANVLIVEYPYKTLQQVRNLLSRFVRLGSELPEEVRRQLKELASCA